MQSEPVDLSRRSEPSHLDKILHGSSLLEDTRNNNDNDTYSTYEDGSKIKKEFDYDKSSWDAKDREEGVKSPWKMVVPLDVSPYYSLGLSQEQKSPTTKNPVPKSPWQSNTQISSVVKSKTVLDSAELKREDEEDRFPKSPPLVLQVPKYNPQLIAHANLGQSALQTSKY